MPSNHLLLSCPLLLLPSIFLSIRVFSNESVLCIRWPKYWSFSFSISPSNEHPGVISFRMDWLDLLAVQGTLKSLLQHHSLKASILQHSAFFIVQLSSHIHTWPLEKTIALTRWTFIGKVMPKIIWSVCYCLNLTDEETGAPRGHINSPRRRSQQWNKAKNWGPADYCPTPFSKQIWVNLIKPWAFRTIIVLEGGREGVSQLKEFI